MVPRSPTPGRHNNASPMHHQYIGSECPSRPTLSLSSTPPRISGRPRTRRCISYPMRFSRCSEVLEVLSALKWGPATTPPTPNHRGMVTLNSRLSQGNPTGHDTIRLIASSVASRLCCVAYPERRCNIARTTPAASGALHRSPIHRLDYSTRHRQLSMYLILGSRQRRYRPRQPQLPLESAIGVTNGRARRG